MREELHRARRMALLALVFGGLSLGYGARPAAGTYVEFDYNIASTNRARASVFIQLFDTDRPLTTTNFLKYVNNGAYNSSLMHRLALDLSNGAPFVLQGGGYYPSYQSEPAPLNTSLNPGAIVDLDGNLATANPTVNNEYSNSPTRPNVAGTIAMAKLSGDPNSASNQFFFNLEDNSTALNQNNNGGFTVFGQVVGDGMSLINGYATQLPIINMNPDTNDDSTRDGGPFGELPALLNSNTFLPLILSRAKVVDYLGNNLVTTIPAGGLTFANKDAFIDTGTTITGTDALTIGAGRTLGVREGYKLSQTLINHGTLAPGLSLGSITVQSTYFQYSDGALNIDLAGTTADTQYDQLITTGTSFLAGKLGVSLVSGFVPAAGNSFTVLSAGSIIGKFGTFDLPQLTAGLVWNINTTTTAVTLSVADADYNHDGVVNAADYAMWRKTRGQTVTKYSGADGNGDGIVNDADYMVWRSNIGNTSGGTHGAGSLVDFTVPEPSSCSLVLFAAFLTILSRRRSVIARC